MPPSCLSLPLSMSMPMCISPTMFTSTSQSIAQTLEDLLPTDLWFELSVNVIDQEMLFFFKDISPSSAYPAGLKGILAQKWYILMKKLLDRPQVKAPWTNLT